MGVAHGVVLVVQNHHVAPVHTHVMADAREGIFNQSVRVGGGVLYEILGDVDQKGLQFVPLGQAHRLDLKLIVAGGELIVQSIHLLFATHSIADVVPRADSAVRLTWGNLELHPDRRPIPSSEQEAEVRGG